MFEKSTKHVNNRPGVFGGDHIHQTNIGCGKKRGVVLTSFSETLDSSIQFTLPETNCLHLKMDGWNTRFLLGRGLLSGALAVSFRECTSLVHYLMIKNHSCEC